MSITAEIISIPEIKVMSMTSKATMDKIAEIMGGMFDKIGAYVFVNGAQVTGSFALYHPEFPTDNMNIECCFSVAELIPDKGDIVGRTIPGGDIFAALYVHKGPYSGLAQAYSDMEKWIAENKYDYEMLPMREVYLNNPMDTAPDELLTQIIIPLKK